ncbi:MFS transporter [Solihabitans fulvus]|uniref:MFS transporter n=1 Tax=Solihabitans fulvus TaxID=1892852 RepID=A0A5B2XRM4_9PSEU|nr:MFS transporter [Solihabitans fulvus]KAA2265755.1 MFS transporter [Solihabitans fulvus]
MSKIAGVGAKAAPELRRARLGWYAYGWASHTFEATVVTVFMSRYLPAVATNAVGEHGRLHVAGIPLAPGSLFTYVVSACSVLMLVMLPVVGAIADRTGRKRLMLLGFGYVGAASCAAMLFVGLTSWVLGSVLFALAYVSYSCGKIVYNSLLPDLASPDERDRISSVGWAAGYIGGGVLLALNFVASFLIHDSALLARLSLCSAGVWWAVFMLVPLRILRHLPKGAVERRPVSGSVLTSGFRELGDTLRGLRRFPLSLLFLVAYLVYYDGISTVTTLSADYGQKELKLGETTLLTAILIVQFTAFGGALLLGRFADRWGAKRVIAVSLVVWVGIVVAAYFLQVGSALQFFGLALALSIVMGGTQALSRSLFSSMIPKAKEAEYFSLYEISSSGTSALGPLVFGLTLQNTGSYRSAIFSLVVFFVVGLALLLTVNVRKAILAAGNTPPATLGGAATGAEALT